MGVPVKILMFLDTLAELLGCSCALMKYVPAVS